MSVPRSLGGGEVDPRVRMAVLEAIGNVDASTAWVIETGSATAQLAGGWLRHDVAAEILCRDPHAVIGGAIGVPKGCAVAVEGGYQLSGRWPWGSGCRHHTWMAGASVIHDGDRPRLRAGGNPEIRILIFPASEVEIIDTWESTGLRGSGSHDYAVTDIFVPAERSLSLGEPPAQAVPLNLFRGVYLSGPPALAIGVARAMIDELVALASGKTPTRGKTLLRDMPMVQVTVARAEALVGSARVYLYDTVGELWEHILAGGELSPRQRALFRLASTNAMRGALKAAELIYDTAGGSAVFTSGPFDRRFRDLRTMAQHASWSAFTLEPAGRMLLGLEPNAPYF